jgi:hypothetical protein
MTEWDLAYMRRRVQPTDADLSAENARLREQLALAETVRASQVAGLTDGLAKLREEVVRLTKIIDDAWGEA